jgi:hypothetical protein
MTNVIKQSLKTLFRLFNFYLNGYEEKIIKLEKEFKKIITKSNNKKILFTQSFSIYGPSYVHDKLMAYSLSIRGFDICATFCDGIQEIECNVYGGVWQGKQNFTNNCNYCQKQSEELWSFLDKKNIFKYSQYLTQEDFLKIDSIINEIPYDGWSCFIYDDWDFGLMAENILVNNYVVADYKLIKKHEELGRSHLRNLLLCKFACEKIITQISPDRIISNDSFYGMWKIWELLAKKYSIPFYSHWSGTRFGGWTYAYNDAAMNLNFSKSWNNYSKVPLTNNEINRVEKWLEDRALGKDMIIDTASLQSFKNENVDFSNLDKSKPIALLSANVSWDLAALNKEVFYESMMDWIIDTIDWFKVHSEYQLIIKSHPAEFFPGIPETKETVISVIKKQFSELPSNIFILSPKANISFYDLISFSTIGLVYTSTVGLEMAARAIPVISIGRSHYRGYGFTLDPDSRVKYFSILDDVLKGEKNIEFEKVKDLSYKFIKFNFFHYFCKNDLIEFKEGTGEGINIKINKIQDLYKGRNKHFDYVLGCIEKGTSILNKDKWIGES